MSINFVSRSVGHNQLSAPFSYKFVDSSIEPLTPNHLLTQKSRIVVSPPGEFVRQDLYLSKRWRRVQYLANIFWTRWRQEYLCEINKRQKWSGVQRNMEVGDVVLICDENLARNDWRLARVVETFTSSDNLVRSVRLQIATADLDKNGRRQSDIQFLNRPVLKLI